MFAGTSVKAGDQRKRSHRGLALAGNRYPPISEAVSLNIQAAHPR